MSAFIQDSATAFQQELAATAQHLATVLPAPAAHTIDAGIAHVAAAGLTRHALAAGQLAPNFTLPDANGAPQTLTGLLQEGPVVLTFYRGNWCPYCNVQLRAYQQVLPELARYGATLVAVSPQTPELTSLTASEKELSFPVLSDVGNTVARQYGLAYGVGTEVGDALRSVGIDLAAFNGTTDDELPLTATFLIGTDGIIAWAEVDANFKQRPDPTAILAALAKLPTAIPA
ncbi:peroxiredoxin-like family protein [Hymenobacter ginsengisoli]|uniref:thioredoxin-dependent peroxiredoxin n=1 Tax=Hymenobacter ginsengisoli TaxID=1051626 RepID=A0ABP8QIG9_9BACT|nr:MULTISPECIES: peroxiredoxin-like family protein [unclassified Hymenobacter]MBO2029812.1 AhpC/TSA family protein [Hymenobacter sp. BT559]